MGFYIVDVCNVSSIMYLLLLCTTYLQSPERPHCCGGILVFLFHKLFVLLLLYSLHCCSTAVQQQQYYSSYSSCRNMLRWEYTINSVPMVCLPSCTDCYHLVAWCRIGRREDRRERQGGRYERLPSGVSQHSQKSARGGEDGSSFSDNEVRRAGITRVQRCELWHLYDLSIYKYYILSWVQSERAGVDHTASGRCLLSIQ